MTLDLVIMRPELFMLLGFLILLAYGTGGLVTPIAEVVPVIGSFSAENGTGSEQRKSLVPTAGPNHAASALCMWALVWCALCVLLLWFSPLQRIFLGGCFQKDLYTFSLCALLFFRALFVL